MFSKLYHFVSFLVLLVCAETAIAQNYSIDGNRWYEVEVSIFTNQSLGAFNAEIAERFNPSLMYPDAIINLQPASSSLTMEFEQPVDEIIESPFFTRDNRYTQTFEPTFEEETAPIMLGPEYSPGSKDFRIADSSIDAFIILGDQFHQFETINQKINNSNQHRILYHAVWRQPMLSKNQSRAIFISGGDQLGLHSELEGSITLSYNVNRIDADVNLWRNSFTAATTPTPWLVPAPVFINDDVTELSLTIAEVAQMKERRAMISNNIHYLDHPAFGMLIEVRPYQLPTPEGYDLTQ